MMRKWFMLLAASMVGLLTQAQIVGTYYADWSLSPVSAGITRIAPGQFTALPSFNLVVEFGDGNISSTPPYYTVVGGGKDSTKYMYSDYYNPDGRWIRWQDSLSRTVHRNGGKVVITIQAVDPTALKTIQADSAKTENFCMNAAQYAKRRGLDGLEVDEEYWQSPEPPGDQLARFYRILRRRVDEAFLPVRGIIILTAGRYSLSTYSQVNKNDVDYVFFMLYDYQWVWSVPKSASVVYYFSPLNTPAGGTGTNASSISNHGPITWADAGWPRSKCVFGIPAYGFMFKGAGALWETYNGYTEVVSSSLPTALANGGVQGWDPVAQEPYISGTAARAFTVRTTSGGSYSVPSGGKFFISYENQQSLQAKCDYIRTQGFGGIFLYDVGGDVDASKPGGTYTPLHSALVSNDVPPVQVAPSGAISASPVSLPVGGGNVTISYSSLNATTASISQGVGSVTPNVSGSIVTFVSTSRIFTLTLSNSVATLSYSVSVSVSVPVPVDTCSAKVSAAYASGNAAGYSSGLSVGRRDTVLAKARQAQLTWLFAVSKFDSVKSSVICPPSVHDTLYVVKPATVDSVGVAVKQFEKALRK